MMTTERFRANAHRLWCECHGQVPWDYWVVRNDGRKVQLFREGKECWDEATAEKWEDFHHD